MSESGSSNRESERVRQRLEVRVLEVREVIELSATMRRIVFAIVQGVDAPLVRRAPADHVKLVLPTEDGHLPMPSVVDDRWVRDDPTMITRDYTIRAAGEGSLTIDFVLHDHGPAGRWAAAAAPGDRLAALGPRGSVLFPTGYARYLIAGDETAIPAVSRWIEDAPAESALDVILEVAGPRSVQELPVRDRMTVKWAFRDRGASIASVLESVDIDEDTFVFIAGEATALIPIRRRLLRELGVDRHRVDVDGYWRAGFAGHDHHLPVDEGS